jgi:hypothetical protein
MTFAYFEGVKYDLTIDEERKTYQNLYHREWNKKNKEKVAQYQRNYQQNNRDKVNERAKRHFENLPEEKKAELRKRAAEKRWIMYNFNADYKEKKKTENRE